MLLAIPESTLRRCPGNASQGLALDLPASVHGPALMRGRELANSRRGAFVWRLSPPFVRDRFSVLCGDILVIASVRLSLSRRRLGVC